jgi:hypothetical protein
MQLAERVSYPTPVGRCLGRPAVHVGHDHQTVGEQPAIRGWDRHRHGQAVTVEVLEELGLPGEIGVASGPKATDSEAPVESHIPHVVGDSASEGFDASDVVTPLLECLPSRCHRRSRVAFDVHSWRLIVLARGPAPVVHRSAR